MRMNSYRFLLWESWQKLVNNLLFLLLYYEEFGKNIYILFHTMSCCEHPSFVDDGGSTVSVSTGTKDPPSRTELAVQICQPRPLTDVS